MIFFLMITNIFAFVIDETNFKLDLGDKWNCNMQKASTVCRNKKNWFIVITKKPADSSYDLLVYKKTLSKSKMNLKEKPSKVYSHKFITVNGEKMVQAHHAGGELPNHDTLYLAGVLGKNGILIGLTAPEKEIVESKKEFERLKKLMRF